MAMQPDIQYVSFYMDGSAAKKLEKRTARAVAAPKPKAKKSHRKVVKVDPVAVLGILVAIVMLTVMLTSYADYRSNLNQQVQMNQYIQALQQENTSLQTQYADGYDLDRIREQALAVGMVPAESAERISIDVQVPQVQEPVQEMSFWEAATTFLAGLFA